MVFERISGFFLKYFRETEPNFIDNVLLKLKDIKFLME